MAQSIVDDLSLRFRRVEKAAFAMAPMERESVAPPDAVALVRQLVDALKECRSNGFSKVVAQKRAALTAAESFLSRHEQKEAGE